MEKMMLQIEMKPIPFRKLGLQTAEVRHLQIEKSAGPQLLRDQRQSLLRMIQVLQNMPKEYCIEMLFREMALFQGLGIDVKAFNLTCPPGCQFRALNAIAFVP